MKGFVHPFKGEGPAIAIDSKLFLQKMYALIDHLAEGM